MCPDGPGTSSGYGAHRPQLLRLEGERAWAELNPAFGYGGLKLRTSTVREDHNITTEPMIESEDQFAAEMDHMALCVQATETRTPPARKASRTSASPTLEPVEQQS